jgi:protein-disulfide isomerase
MNRKILSFALVLAAGAAALSLAPQLARQGGPAILAPAQAASPALAPRVDGGAAVPAQVVAETTPDDRVLGSADAPVTMIEYASLTCPHCATFHSETLPQIKAKYIDTGKVKLVFRDFPFDELGLRAAMTAHCLEPGSYFGFLDVLFRSQDKWSRAANPMEALKQLARLAGMQDDAFDACQKDEAVADRVLKGRIDAQNNFDVRATPTFIINDQKISGAQSFEKMSEIIEPLLPDS